MTRISLAWLALLVVACGEPDNGLDLDGVCEDQPCSGHGTCVESGAVPACECDAGFHAEGLTCVEDGMTGPCNGVTCSGHGVCTDAGGDATCICETGYHAEQLSCVEDGTLGPCANVDCGNGACVDNSGEATCQCDPGYHADGLTCRPDCIAWPGTLDVPRVYVSGTVTLAGGPLTYGATLRFVETTTGDAFTVAVDADGLIEEAGGPVPIAPGTYRIYYSKRGGGGWATEPWNASRLLATVNLTANQQLALDVPRVFVGGTVTLAGGALAYGATLRFEDTTTNDTFTVGVDANGLIEEAGGPVPIAPGTYRIYYSKRGGGGWATEPWNSNRLLATVNLTANQTLALDVPRVFVAGTVTLAGGALTYGATLRFEDTTTSDTFTVGVDANGLIEEAGGPVPIAPGSYRIYYSKRGGGGWTTEPWNSDRLLATVNLAANQTLALDVPRVYIGGAVTVAGGPLAYGATLRFVETTTEDSFTVGVNANGLIEEAGGPVPIAPGNYRIYYSKRGGGGWTTEPWNSNRLLATVNLTANQTLALDVPRVYIGGTVTVAGGPLAYGATLRFVETTTEDSFTVGVDANGLIEEAGGPIPIAPGSYRIYYSKRGGGGWTTEPWNSNRLLATVNLTANQELALDVPRRTLTGTVTLAGGALSYGASLQFANAFDDNDAFSVGVAADGQLREGTSPIPLAPGSYRILYSKRGGGGWSTEPWNTARPLGCYTIP